MPEVANLVKVELECDTSIIWPDLRTQDTVPHCRCPGAKSWVKWVVTDAQR